MKTENRHINFQEPEGMMLLRYIKDTASNEEKSYIEAWLEADENNQRILLQTARIYYANNAMERIASRNPLIAYEVGTTISKTDPFILAEEVLCRCGLYNCYHWAIKLNLIYKGRFECRCSSAYNA